MTRISTEKKEFVTAVLFVGTNAPKTYNMSLPDWQEWEGFGDEDGWDVMSKPKKPNNNTIED